MSELERTLDENWQERERSRWLNRELPVWHEERWWVDNYSIWGNHFVHRSVNNPALLAYTESEAKGKRDIQTPIKPGRYLSKFFGKILTEKQIAYYAAWQTSGARPVSEWHDAKRWSLAFAWTQDEIISVYKDGPRSCMSGDHFDDDNNPVRVYAAGDLAVAYLHDGGGMIKARALVWPERKVVGRIYPTPDNWMDDGFECRTDSEDCQLALLKRLQGEGYRMGGIEDGVSFEGARLLILESNNGGWVMPYLDGAYGVYRSGSFWRMTADQTKLEYRCDTTDGRIESGGGCTCDECGDDIEDDGSEPLVATRVHSGRLSGFRTWCESCRNSYAFYCEGFGEYVSEIVPHTVIRGADYCDAWLEQNAFLSQHSNEWFLNDDDEPVDVDGETWALSEAREDAHWDDEAERWTTEEVVDLEIAA